MGELEELRERLRRIDASERATGRGSWEWDVTHDKAYWSPGMYALFGVDQATFANTNENFLARVHPDDRERMMAAMGETLRRPGPFRQEYRLVRPDGGVRQLRGVGDVVLDRDGQPTRLFGFVEDITERERAQSIFRDLLETAPDAIVIVDTHGRIQLVNERTRTLFGYSREELVGKSVEMLVPEAVRDRHVGHRDAFFHDPKPRPMGHGLELHGRRKDGTQFPVEISLSPLRTPEGQLVSAAIRDVTQRKGMEQELRASRDFLAQAERSAQYGSFEIDVPTMQIKVSEGFKAAFGLAPDTEKPLQELTAMVIDEDRQAALDVTARALTTVGSLYFTYRLRRADGEVRSFDVNMTTIAGPDGKPGRVVGIARDLTDRQAEEAKFQALMEGAPDAIVVVGHDGKIALVNRQAEALFGYGRKAMLGQPVEMLIPQRFQTTHPKHRGAFFAHPGTRAMGEGLDLWARRRDGTEFPVEISLSPLPGGPHPMAMAAVRDVSERRRLEVDRQRAKEQEQQIAKLREQSDFRSRFINNAAHELRTPLLPLRAQVFWLTQQSDATRSPEEKEALEVIRRNLDRLGVLVEDLLAASRLQTGKLAVDPKPADVHAIARQAVDSFKAAAAERGLALSFREEGDGKAMVDSKKVSQVIYNLMSNALKFTPRGGAVGVESRGADDAVVVRVTDTGIGVSAGNLAKLFAPFSQVHDVMQVTDPGSGLGLYISRAIIELHGGSIVFDSPGEDRGTTVAVSLPRRAASASGAAPASAEGGPATAPSEPR